MRNIFLLAIASLSLQFSAQAIQFPEPGHSNVNDSFPCTHCYPCSLKAGGLPLCKDGLKDPFVAAFTGAVPLGDKADVAK